MLFTVRFRLSPAAAFGVPDPDHCTVLPITAKDIGFPHFHPVTGEVVGHGPMPDYRSEEDALRLTAHLVNATLRFNDNYVYVSVDTPTALKAQFQATAALDGYLGHLSSICGTVFTFDILSVDSTRADSYPPQQHFDVSMYAYNLPKIRDAVGEAAKATAISDRRYLRALGYHNHASFLSGHLAVAMLPDSHRRHLAAAVFLNYWKAVSTLLGDPAKKDRDHQRRYRKYGLSKDFFEKSVKRLYKLRNDYDVAHYSLDPEKLDQLKEEVGFALRTSEEVLAAVRRSLLQA